MDYYRHCFNFKDVQLNLLNTLADFGFVDKSTGDPLYDSFKPHADSDVWNWKTLRWNHDLKAELNFPICMKSIKDQYVGIQVKPSSWSETRQSGPTGWKPITSLAGTLDSVIPSYSILGITVSGNEQTPVTNDSYYQNIILIPLINGGFLYNIKIVRNDYTHIDPTPKLKIIGERLIGYEVNRTLIGLPNTLNTNLKNYLYFGIEGYNNNNVETTNPLKYFLTDYQNTEVLNYIPFINENCTDLNNNICTLIKMPYDNGYLDNVYMMATRPGELTKEGGFFSFAGRNFINVYKNLVLELPS